MLQTASPIFNTVIVVRSTTCLIEGYCLCGCACVCVHVGVRVCACRHVGVRGCACRHVGVRGCACRLVGVRGCACRHVGVRVQIRTELLLKLWTSFLMRWPFTGLPSLSCYWNLFCLLQHVKHCPCGTARSRACASRSTTSLRKSRRLHRSGLPKPWRIKSRSLYV